MYRLRHTFCAWLLVSSIAACTTPWERHQAALREHAARGEWKAAANDELWLIDNEFIQAPPQERNQEAEAARQLRLAQLAAKAGDNHMAVQALREALTLDPSRANAIRAQLNALALSPAEAAQVKREFDWNIAALAPGEDPPEASPHEHLDAECWSYRVREVRIRQQHTIRTANGMERQVTYDARPWVYDAGTHRWSADGTWVNDIGTEVEPVDGPPRPHYRAVAAAQHGFYADGAVPPCHRRAWHGPFETDGTIFVAKELPAG